MAEQQGRYWSVTAYGDNIGKLHSDQSSWPTWLKAILGGDEECPSTGRLHAQVMLHCSRPVRAAAIKKWLPGAHIEIATDPKKLKSYVMKKETAVGEKTIRTNNSPNTWPLWFVMMKVMYAGLQRLGLLGVYVQKKYEELDTYGVGDMYTKEEIIAMYYQEAMFIVCDEYPPLISVLGNDLSERFFVKNCKYFQRILFYRQDNVDMSGPSELLGSIEQDQRELLLAVD